MLTELEAAILTEMYLPDEHTRKALLRYLRQADKANERQQSRWLAEYVQLVQKVRGRELPAVQADTLIRLVRALL